MPSHILKIVLIALVAEILSKAATQAAVQAIGARDTDYLANSSRGFIGSFWLYFT